MSDSPRSFIEVQFPIGPLSLESYLERDARTGKVLNSLGKWWGAKPIVLTRAIIIGSLLPASDDPEKWPDDLATFLRLMCFDSAGMWARRLPDLKAISSKPPHPTFASLCLEQAEPEEFDLFKEETGGWKPRMTDEEKERRAQLERQTFFTLSHHEQRRYCRRVEEIDGPPPESWAAINEACGTKSQSLQEWIAEMSERRFGHRVRVGDAFSGMGSIPYAAAELGCDVYASDLNPVASLMTWGALNIIAGEPDFHARVLAAQREVYEAMDQWYLETGFEASEEGWRGTLYFYCVEIEVPEWDGWRIPVSATWQMLKSNAQVWIELIPDPKRKRFDFKVHYGTQGYAGAAAGTKQDSDIVCPDSLWELLRKEGKIENSSRRIALNHLIANHGGLRKWEKSDFVPRAGDFYGERLYCIRWETDKGKNVFREPQKFDEEKEAAIEGYVRERFGEWQEAGWIPNWRIEDGAKTRELIRTRGWTHWHQLFTPRQLLMAAEYSQRIATVEESVRPALVLGLGQLLNYGARLCQWHPGGNSTTRVFYNQAFNTFLNYVCRSWAQMDGQTAPEHYLSLSASKGEAENSDSRHGSTQADIWITDPPYADAVNYEELSEFFLSWYQPHLKRCFPHWHSDSRRKQAVKGDDASFRVSMTECYRNLADHMPNDGLQILMFTHKDTDVWEDVALIMWAAGLQVKQVWSVATEKKAAAIKKGHYVQATYNMVLRKRPADAPEGFQDFIMQSLQERVREVITHMRESQISGGLTVCGYTDTDYLLAAQAVAAEVVTGYSSIDGIDLEAELRTPNKERGKSALRALMENAKRTATDFLVPDALDASLRATKDGSDAYRFWREFGGEEKFLLKGLEMEAGGVDKLGAFQDLGRAYGLAEYEDLLGPAEANNARTKLPHEFGRADSTRYDAVSPTDRGAFRHSITRHVYESLKLLHQGEEIDRAVQQLVDHTNFWEIRKGRLAVILNYLKTITANNETWADYETPIASLVIAVENWRV